MNLIDQFSQYQYIFFDFDGVIKDSIEVKSDAFVQLFRPFGEVIADKVRQHHEANGGMSRFEKIPLYLSWAGIECDQKLVSDYSDRFSSLVEQRVIESDWVPGVESFLKMYHQEKKLFLVTATPQKEIEEITKTLNIDHFFYSIIGAPTKKSEAINWILGEYHISGDQAVMVGDSSSDYQGAVTNNVSFILRRTPLNHDLQLELDCQMIENFINE